MNIINTLMAQFGYHRINSSNATLSNKEEKIEIPAPTKRLCIADTNLMFHIHSDTESSRVRKFKEPWTIKWLRELPKHAVLYDAGANIGITSLVPTEDQERHVKVVAIEPAPANFISLVKNIHLNKCEGRVYPLAIGLGHATDVTNLKLTTNTPGGAMHSFGEIVVNKLDKIHKPIATHFCMRMKLDDLVRWPGLPFPTHIKVDIDGGEMDLLAGATAVLSDARCKALQIEVVDADSTHRRSKELIDFMTSFGFSVVAYYDHNNTFPRGRDIQFAR